MPKISIILPVYNVAQYLRECLDSIQEQTFKDFEAILIDDGSTDGSGEICDWYASKYKRFKVIHKSNGGVSYARNMGLDIAQGEFIGFVDPDDFISHDFYEMLLHRIESSGADISISDVNVINQNGFAIAFFEQTKAQSRESYAGSDIFRALMKGEIAGSCCDKLFRNTLFYNTRFNEAISKGEDTEVLLRILPKTKKAVFEGKAKYFYRMRKGSSIHLNYTFKEISQIFFVSDLIGTTKEKYFPETGEECDFFQWMIKTSGIIRLFADKRESRQYIK